MTRSPRMMWPAAAALLAALASPARPEPESAPRPPERGPAVALALKEIVDRTPLAQARTSILVESLESGETLYERDPDTLLNPASNVKLFTSAAALARLGPEYRFATEVLADALPAGGAVRSLYLRGRGDPTLVTERLWALAGDIAHRGVRAVRGDLVVDDGFFDAEREGPGYDQERGDRSYLAPVGALSLNWNVVGVEVGPGERVGDHGRVELEPASDYLVLENRTRTVRAGSLRRVTATSTRLEDGRQRVSLEGRVPLASRDQILYRKIDDPPAYFGATLKRLLELRGVKVAGTVRHTSVPDRAVLLAVAESEPLGEIVRRLEKHSNNFVAEQILKTLGAERKGPPGSWAKGVEAVEDFLSEIGIPRGSYVMKNGSGLNDANRFSARQTVTLLRAMWQRFPLMAEFLAALPIAGRDGTTRFRMESTDGRLRAKTGTLDNVTSLSGYVETAAHERLAFSILVNDFPGRLHASVRAVDALGGALAAAGGPPAEPGREASLAAAPAAPPLAASEDARAHFAAYRLLGSSGDKRNVPFLRTALATEEDPLARMAAAEALHLSDPDSDTLERLFLESLSADPKVLALLPALAAGPDAPLPVLTSLGDLAAEGRPEALARLVDLSAPAASDGRLASTFADLWQEVALNAPDEVLRALCAAKSPGSDAATALLARGIGAAPAPPHPFRAALARAAADADPGLAACARSLAPHLDEGTRTPERPASEVAPAPGERADRTGG